MKKGRPRTITQEKINEMKFYLQAGLKLKEACTLAEIPYTTWHDFEHRNPDFKEKRKEWKNMLKVHSQLNIARQILTKHDPKWSAYWLKHDIELEEKRTNNAFIRAQTKKVQSDIELNQAKTKALTGGNDEQEAKICELLDKVSQEAITEYDNNQRKN